MKKFGLSKKIIVGSGALLFMSNAICSLRAPRQPVRRHTRDGYVLRTDPPLLLQDFGAQQIEPHQLPNESDQQIDPLPIVLNVAVFNRFDQQAVAPRLDIPYGMLFTQKPENFSVNTIAFQVFAFTTQEGYHHACKEALKTKAHNVEVITLELNETPDNTQVFNLIREELMRAERGAVDLRQLAGLNERVRAAVSEPIGYARRLSSREQAQKAENAANVSKKSQHISDTERKRQQAVQKILNDFIKTGGNPYK
jgi:hypothetical protein